MLTVYIVLMTVGKLFCTVHKLLADEMRIYYKLQR